MTLDEAIEHIRADPRYTEQVRDSYIGPDHLDSAQRFLNSSEFKEVLAITGGSVEGKTVVDLGSGVGIASYAFARSGALKVYAVEPDISEKVGRSASESVTKGLPIEHVAAFGESLPLLDSSVDLFYTRQVLHHTTDLNKTLQEAARVLKPGGFFLGTREHVVDDDQELAKFLAQHPLHQLAGGEHAYRLRQYCDAIRRAPLDLTSVMGLFDSLMNSYPGISTQSELRAFPRNALKKRLGILGIALSFIPGVSGAVKKRLEKRVPGRMYSFLAIRP